MGLVVVAGAIVVALGLVVHSDVVLAVGAMVAFAAVLGFLVPGFRDAPGPLEDPNRNTDFGFLLGLLRGRPGRKPPRR